MILKISKLAMAILHAKACFRGRTRDSGTQSQIAAGSMWQIFGGPARRIRSAGSEIETLENHFVKNHFLINISLRRLRRLRRFHLCIARGVKDSQGVLESPLVIGTTRNCFCEASVWVLSCCLVLVALPSLHPHHLMRCKSRVSNPRIEYKSEFSNPVQEFAQSVII